MSNAYCSAPPEQLYICSSSVASLQTLNAHSNLQPSSHQRWHQFLISQFLGYIAGVQQNWANSTSERTGIHYKKQSAIMFKIWTRESEFIIVAIRVFFLTKMGWLSVALLLTHHTGKKFFLGLEAHAKLGQDQNIGGRGWGWDHVLLFSPSFAYFFYFLFFPIFTNFHTVWNQENLFRVVCLKRKLATQADIGKSFVAD